MTNTKVILGLPMSEAEHTICHHDGKNFGDIMKARKNARSMPFFEMRNELKGPGLRYAYRLDEDNYEWLTYYDVKAGKFRKTDFLNNEDYELTVDDLIATDWVVYIFQQ